MSEFTIEWGTPPERNWNLKGRAPSPEIVAFADALRGRPGSWAVLHDRATNWSAVIKQGKSVFGPAGSFEAMTRNVHKGKGDLWARYVGEDK